MREVCPLACLGKASQIVRRTKGFRHIKGFDYWGVPHTERKYLRVRDKVMCTLHKAMTRME